MLAFICAQCGETSFDFTHDLVRRKHRIKCKRCGSEFTAEVKQRDEHDNDVNIPPVTPPDQPLRR